MKKCLITGTQCFALMAIVGIVLSLSGLALAGGITVYEKDGKYVKLGGRIQLQYHYMDPDNDNSEDDVFFRRLRPYIEGSLHKDWKGKFQIDYGKAENDNELAIKDAYFQYKGFKNVKISIGNANFPFSREFLTSSKYQQLVERTFVGDHNYGTPDRNTGVHVTGLFMDKKLEFGASGTAADIDPDEDKLDFDTPVNRKSDFNEGWMIGGRVDYHPLGFVKKSQGDLARSKGIKGTIGVGAFTWSNDDDNNTYTVDGIDIGKGKPDVDKVTGFELSGAFRGYGVSIDAEYNLFNADTVDNDYTGGLYKDGDTDLKNFAVEGGVIVIRERLEIVGGYQWQDADNYDNNWTRTSFGANLFVKKHDIKLQTTYRMGKNIEGIKDNDEKELFVQAQYVF